MTTMTAKAINVRVPETLYTQLEALAKATTRTKSFLTIQALESYLETESWQIQDIQQGIREADASEFASMKEVNAVFQKYGA
jgi:RHH-type rel operon transcriptional repressor/antitoxin RelB